MYQAILIKLHIERFTNRREDKEFTDTINKSFGITKGRYIKEELIDRRAIQALESNATSARNFIKRSTLPWQDGGVRILANAMAFEVLSKVQEFKERDAELVRELVDKYDFWITKAKNDLGPRFNASEYPQDIASRYVFDFRTFNVSDMHDIRLDIPEEQKRLLAENMRQSMEMSMKEATIECLKRIQERCQKIWDILSDPLRSFRTSTIDNAGDTIATIMALDVTQNDNVKSIGEWAINVLSTLDSETIKTNEAFNAMKARELTQIIGALESAIEDL